jgi:hypothetical protein
MAEFHNSTEIPVEVEDMGYTVEVLCYAVKFNKHFLAWYDTDEKEWRAYPDHADYLVEEFVWTYLPKP